MKGLPLDRPGLRIDEIGRHGWNALRGDLPLPLMLLRGDIVDANIAAMAAWCRERGVELAPHGKTTMAPELFRRRARARPGVRALLPGRLHRRRHADGVSTRRRRRAASRPRARRGRPVRRPGRCRTVDEAVAVAEAIVAAPHLRLAGVEAFEGLRRADDLDEAIAGVDALLARVVEVFERLRDLLPERPLLTAGGSAFFDRVAKVCGTIATRPVTAVLRSGCYVTQDGGFYGRVSPLGTARGGPLRNALEVWGAVLSRPEPGPAITSFGRRDVPIDMGLPLPFATAREGRLRPLAGAETIALSDQHGHVTVPPDADIRPGDLLGATISHPCGAFDRWQLLLDVDDAYDVVGAIETVF